MLRLASGTAGGGVSSNGIGLGGKGGASSRMVTGVSEALPSPVADDVGDFGASVPLLAFFTVIVCVVVVVFGDEPKNAYQRVKRAATPSAIAAIIFFRSDLGVSSGDAIACSLKISE